MSARDTSPLDPLELSIRARRGEPSPVERRDLARGLETSAVARTAHRVGQDFDAVLRVRPGDEALLERVSRAAVAEAFTRARRRRPLGAALGVALALVVGTAGASVGGLWQPAKTSILQLFGEQSAPAVVRTGSRPRAKPSSHEPAPRRTPSPEPALVPAVPGAPAESKPEATPPSVSPAATKRATGSATPHEAPPPNETSKQLLETTSAASLFRAASAARRAGDLLAAQNLYNALQSSFPQTEEARVSRVSLGKLLLASGDARGAERQFAGYITSGGTNLAEEALVGRAESLARLGERGEERRVWLLLLARFGGGVYAERAQKRLDELNAPNSH